MEATPKQPKERKSVVLNMRLTSTVKAAAEVAAEADSRSLTSLIEKLLKDYLRIKGRL